MTQRFNEVHPRLRPPVCSISLILSQRSSKNSQMENYNREEIRLVFKLRDVCGWFDEHMRPLFIEVITFNKIPYLIQRLNGILNYSKKQNAKNQHPMCTATVCSFELYRGSFEHFTKWLLDCCRPHAYSSSIVLVRA